MNLQRLIISVSIFLLSSCASITETPEYETVFNVVTTDLMASSLNLSNTEIVGGQTVDVNNPLAKLVVLIQVSRPEKTSVCTAALIAPQILLTAAHCVSKVKPEKIKAFFHTSPFENPDEQLSIQAENITVHEKYDGLPKNQADIALVRLVAKAPSIYPPLSIYTKEDTLADDEALLLGYGITDEKKADSGVLRKIVKSYKTDLYVREKIVGVEQRSNSGGFCRGDSGAPILVNSSGTKKIVGINSFTVGIEADTECHTASVAMYVPHYADWIKKKISQ